MNEIYYLADKFSSNAFYAGLFLLDKNELKYLNLNKEIDGEIIKWHLSISKNRKIEIEENESMLDAFFKKDKTWNSHYKERDDFYFQKMISKPGEFFPRIYRPVFIDERRYENLFTNYTKESNQDTCINIFYKKELVSVINQLSVLTESLNLLFQNIQPEENNFNVYGHNIRNLLILTCTEIEAQLKGILTANLSVQKNTFTTKDYVKLLTHLKLNEYSIDLGYYPWIKEIKPFVNWNPTSPTKSLIWYDNYNAVKHNRENEFHKATLKSVIESLSALAILIIAQYGNDLPFWKEQIGGFYLFKSTPNWGITDYYIPPFKGEEWKMTKKEI